MSQDLVNADAFAQRAPSKAFAHLRGQDSLADGIGAAYPVIRYKGKNWSLDYRGERYTFKRPDDGSPISFIDVVILRQAPHKSKSFYPEYDNQAEGVRPICSSMDGITPDDGVQQKQADHCAVCPRNEFKIKANGKKGKECSDFKRLAVLLMPNQTKALLGEPLMEPAFLRVPAASLVSLANMGDTMDKRGYHYSEYITRISFVPEQAHPQMLFKAMQPLGDEEAPAVLAMRDDPTSSRIIGDSDVGHVKQIAAPAQVNVAAFPPKVNVTSISERAILEARKNPNPTTITLQAEEDKPATFADLVQEKPATVTSEGAVITHTKNNPAPKADPAEESDEDLDARVAAIMKSLG